MNKLKKALVFLAITGIVSQFGLNDLTTSMIAHAAPPKDTATGIVEQKDSGDNTINGNNSVSGQKGDENIQPQLPNVNNAPQSDPQPSMVATKSGNDRTPKKLSDNEKPVSSAGPLLAEYQTSTIVIPFHATDNVNLALIELYYKKNLSDSWTPVLGQTKIISGKEASGNFSFNTNLPNRLSGTYYFASQAIDAALNVEDLPQAPDAQTIVNTRPYVTNFVLSPGENVSHNVSVTINFSEILNSAPLVDVFKNNALVGSFSGSFLPGHQSWQGSLDVTGYLEGTYQISVNGAMNLLGEVMIPDNSHQLIVDHTAPVATIAFDPWHDPYTFYDLTINISFNEPMDVGQPLSAVLDPLGPTSVTGGHFVDNQTWQGKLNIDSSWININKFYNLKVNGGTDLAGNVMSEATHNFQIDTIKPVITSWKFEPDSGSLKIGDTLKVTFTTDEALGYITGSVNNVPQIWQDPYNGQPERVATYIIKEGDQTVGPGDKLNVHLTIADMAGNVINFDYYKEGIQIHADRPAGPIVTVKSGDGYVKLNWSAVPDIQEYKIYRAAGPYQLLATVYGTSFTDYNVKNGQDYEYKIASVDSFGNETLQATLIVYLGQPKTGMRSEAKEEIGRIIVASSGNMLNSGSSSSTSSTSSTSSQTGTTASKATPTPIPTQQGQVAGEKTEATSHNWPMIIALIIAGLILIYGIYYYWQTSKEEYQAFSDFKPTDKPKAGVTKPKKTFDDDQNGRKPGRPKGSKSNQ